MCFAPYSRSHKCYFGVMQSYHPYSSTTCWSPGERKCLCVFVCVFLGSPLGRGRAVIACSSPGAGYGHPGHVSCNGAKHHCGSLCFHSNTRYFPISSDVFWPPTLTSVSPKAHLGFHLHTYFATCFSKLHVSLLVIPSLCHTHSPSTSVFWQGCISSLAVLLRRGGEGGGVPRDVRVH